MSDLTYSDQPADPKDYMPPVTPYPEPGGGATSGHAGSETSRDRALTEDANGITSRRQQRVMQLLTSQKFIDHLGGGHWVGQHYGMTVIDLRMLTGWHHGQASSALSVLHKDGQIARLTERRDRCAVYVLPEYVRGRETATVGRTAATPAPPTLTDSEQRRVTRVRRDATDNIHGWDVSRELDGLLDIIERLTRG